MTNELTNSLFDVMNSFMHRNYVVEKLIGAYRVMGKVVKTMGEVDRIIDDKNKQDAERPKRTS